MSEMAIMTQSPGIFRNAAAVRRHAAWLAERGLDKTIMDMPRGEFRMRDLDHPPGNMVRRLKGDGIILKVRNGGKKGTVWKRGINWRVFAEVFK